MKSLITLFTVFLLTACQTMPDEHCDDYGKRRVGELSSADFELIQSGSAQVKEGTIVFGQFGNAKTGMISIDATVDTPELARLMLADGFDETGRCYRGSHVWFTVIYTAPVTGEET